MIPFLLSQRRELQMPSVTLFYTVLAVGPPTSADEHPCLPKGQRICTSRRERVLRWAAEASYFENCCAATASDRRRSAEAS